MMKTLSKATAKGTIATVVAGALAISSASPAFADRRDRDGVSAGEIIAGALVIGGIAAVASAASKNGGYNSDYRYDRAGYGYDGSSRDYDRGYGYDNDRSWRGSPRRAVEQCVFAAERDAMRYSYGRAKVTDIREVRDTRNGYEVRGRIAMNSRGRDWRHGDGNYGQGWGGDYRGWNAGMRGYDSGSFKCRIDRGRIVDLDYKGLRGL